MANDLQAIADTLITQAAVAFRNQSKMPMLVNRNYDAQATEKNKVIEVDLFPAMTVADVDPATPSASTNLVPVPIQIKMDQWKETRWTLTDKEMAEVQDSRVLPPVVERGLMALGDTIDLFILNGLYRAAHVMTVSAGPSAAPDVIALRKELNRLKAPRDGRSLVVSDTIEAELLNVNTFQAVDASGSTEGLREASLGRKFGFEIFSNGQMPTHTKGNPSGTVTGTGTADSPQLLSGGTQEIVVAVGAGAFLAGDRFHFANHATIYSIVRVISATAIEIAPRLKTTVSASAITLETDASSYDIGALAFQKLAYVLAVRPLSSQSHPSTIESTATDPMTGLTFRLEVTRVHKQLVWGLDVLWGGRVLYPDAIVRMRD